MGLPGRAALACALLLLGACTAADGHGGIGAGGPSRSGSVVLVTNGRTEIDRQRVAASDRPTARPAVAPGSARLPGDGTPAGVVPADALAAAAGVLTDEQLGCVAAQADRVLRGSAGDLLGEASAVRALAARVADACAVTLSQRARIARRLTG